MPCTEAYKEHIMYTFHGFCNIVIRNAAITAWRDQHRRHKREISLEYLTEEKFYPLGTTDKYFEDPHEEYPIKICGQTVILTNGELAAALLSLPEKKGKSFTFTFSRITHSRKSRIYTDNVRVRRGIISTVPYKPLPLRTARVQGRL